MVHKIKIFALLITMAFAGVSCLEKYPDDAILSDKALNTVSDVNQAVYGIYAGFKNKNLYSGALTLCPDIQSDLVYAVEGNSNRYGSFWRWEILPNDKEVEAVYAGLYTIIERCNFVLAYESRVRSNTTSDSDLNDLDELLGEVYFARALAYSELIKMFCKAYDPATAANTLGVVISDSYRDGKAKSRASLEASYQFVLNDLKKASELIVFECLPNGASSDYFTVSAVNALYARVYLYMHEWQKAVTYASKVIGDPALSLAGVNELVTSTQSQYKYMWDRDLSSEVIWRVNFSLSSYGGDLGTTLLGYNYSTFMPDYVAGSWALNLYEASDLRYNVFFSTQTTGYPHRLTWPLLIKYYGNQEFRANRILHVSMPKVFRLSEQYLIRAEAYCKLGDYSKAITDITQLRVKRFSSYGTANISASNWQKVISEERVRELFMEGFRLHDLKRWHMGFERTPQNQTVAPGNKLKIQADAPLFVWPIPQHELDVPGSDIEPNESNN